MKNTFGNNITLTIFGESHGEAIGCVLDGLSPGIDVDEAEIARHLARRRPSLKTDTARREPDNFKILSGVFNGKTTGTPISIVIPNVNKRSKDYDYGKARPSHADYAAFCKYHGFEDFRGGGHFSGRITAALVAAGGILIPALERLGIRIGTHILSCAGIDDDSFTHPCGKSIAGMCDKVPEDCKRSVETMSGKINALKGKDFPVLDNLQGEKMIKEIVKAGEEKDSRGGITETAVLGLPAGLGEPWFDSFEGMLSHAVFSVGAVKGIEFGNGFDMAQSRASECNDEFRVKGGVIITDSNNNGGINGGITNGMPVIFRCAVKPTPSIAIPQKSVDFVKKENIELQINGRHDPAIIRRICPVMDSVCALVVSDMMAGRFGTDFFVDGIPKKTGEVNA